MIVSGDVVSAIMPTGIEDRWKLARPAIESFRLQTYRPRELVIINQSLGTPWQQCLIDGGVEAGDGYEIREYLVRRLPTLGDARNTAVDLCKGEWFIPFDDDDFSHQDRVALMVQRHNEGGGIRRPVATSAYLTYGFPTNTAYVRVWQAGQPAGAMYPKGHRYAALNKGEDTKLLKAHGALTVWDNAKEFPQIYLRLFHGTNTWDANHIMWKWQGEHWKNRWDIPANAVIFLTQVLTRYYGFDPVRFADLRFGH